MADDTARVQAMLDAGGTIAVPPGTYNIEAVKTGLYVRPGTDLSLVGVTLKAIPNNSVKYNILRVWGASNVKIKGGTIVGDRKEHQGTDGEAGMGLSIKNGSAHVWVTETCARECWGDGFYVDGASDVTLMRIVSDHNRRQGLSIIAVDQMTVTGSTFKNTTGTRPMAGIDLEPDAGLVISNVTITGCAFQHNAGPGLLLAAKRGKITKVKAVNNVFDGRPIKIDGATPGCTLGGPNYNKTLCLVCEPLGNYKYSPTTVVVA